MLGNILRTIASMGSVLYRTLCVFSFTIKQDPNKSFSFHQSPRPYLSTALGYTRIYLSEKFKSEGHIILNRGTFAISG